MVASPHIIARYSFALLLSDCIISSHPPTLVYNFAFYTPGLCHLDIRSYLALGHETMPVEASICMRPGRWSCPITWLRHFIPSFLPVMWADARNTRIPSTHQPVHDWLRMERKRSPNLRGRCHIAGSRMRRENSSTLSLGLGILYWIQNLASSAQKYGSEPL